jgi:tRNA pseudouridine55 synthase
MTNLSKQNLWLNIDKPQGFSSAKAVTIVKRLTKASKVGHAGTLDPLASGVLPIAINKATKTCDYIVNHNKKYFFEISWGEFRDTDDAVGKVIESSSKRPKTSEIISNLIHFIGKIQQTPPQFSAIRIDGKKAYQLARSQKMVELKPREVEIFKIKLIANNSVCAQFEIDCGKGTYVRSFARELSERLGVCGYISVLRRLKVGDFLIENTISLDKLKNIVNYDCLDAPLPSFRNVINFIDEVELDDSDALKIKNGQIIKLKQSFLQITEPAVVKIINNGEFIGLGKYYENILRPINIF